MLENPVSQSFQIPSFWDALLLSLPPCLLPAPEPSGSWLWQNWCWASLCSVATFLLTVFSDPLLHIVSHHATPHLLPKPSVIRGKEETVPGRCRESWEVRKAGRIRGAELSEGEQCVLKTPFKISKGKWVPCLTDSSLEGVKRWFSWSSACCNHTDPSSDPECPSQR